MGLAESIRAGAAPETLALLKNQAWLFRGEPGAERILGLLADHARRHEDQCALLQHHLQTLDPAAGRDLDVLGELLRGTEPQDVWALVPAFRVLADVKRDGLLRTVRGIIHSPESPFRYASFHAPAVQDALDQVMSADRSPGRFAEALRRLCADWPYRILFVSIPYGRRGEQLSESAV